MSDVEEVYRYLQEAGIYYLATVDGDRPCVRPFSTVMVYEGRLYLMTGVKKDVYEQLQQNPHVEIAVMARDHKTWIHVIGTLKEDRRPEPLALMEETYPGFAEKYNQSAGSRNALFYFEHGQAVVSAWNRSPVLYRL